MGDTGKGGARPTDQALALAGQASVPCLDATRCDPSRIRDELLIRAGNLERYPFESATMAEAGRLAANAIRNVVGEVFNEQ